jgi:hypothetical protein
MSTNKSEKKGNLKGYITIHMSFRTVVRYSAMVIYVTMFTKPTNQIASLVYGLSSFING